MTIDRRTLTVLIEAVEYEVVERLNRADHEDRPRVADHEREIAETLRRGLAWLEVQPCQ